MRILIKLTVLFCAVLIGTICFAQKQNVTGFYISIPGDTIKGTFPGYSQWRKNPSEVAFASTSQGSIQLTPQNCRKFVVDGYDEYLAYSGQRLVNPITNYEVLNTGDSSFSDSLEEVVTFLRLVTRVPDCELYVFMDSRRANFFFKRPDGTPVELRYKKYYKADNIASNAEYRNQLNNLFSHEIISRNLTASLETLPYTEDALEGFLNRLFVSQPVRQKRPAAGWTVSAGVSLNHINVVTATPYPYVAKEYRSSLSPLLQIGYIAPFRRNFGRYFIFPQLTLFHYRNTGETNDGTYRRVTTYETGGVVSGELDGGANIINQSNCRLYLSGGIGVLTLLNNQRQDLTYLNSQPSAEAYQASQTRIDFEAAPFVDASIGLLLGNKLLIESTYLFPTQIDDVIDYTPRFRGLQFSIGYKFK